MERTQSEEASRGSIHATYRYSIEYDASFVEEQDLTPETVEQHILPDVVRDSTLKGDFTVQEGRQAPTQVNLSDVGVFLVVTDRATRTWLAETDDPEEARKEIEQWFDGGLIDVYFEGTLEDALSEMLRDGSAKLENLV